MPQDIVLEELEDRIRKSTKKSQELEYDNSIAIASANKDPINYKEAIVDSDKNHWLDTMQEEVGKLED